MSAQPSNAPCEPAPTSAQYLTFALGDELFAIPILAVQEIRGLENVSRIPRSRDDVLGVMSLRGVVVPVIDLRRRLGLASSEQTATTVVILVRVAAQPGNPMTVGCVVDAVSDVAHFADSAVRAAPGTCGSIDRHFLRGVVESDGRLALLLDLALLLGAQERTPAATGDAA